MSPVQAGGGKGSGQKPGNAAGGRPPAGTKPSSGARGANGAGQAPGRRPAPGTKTGSGPGANRQGAKGAPAKGGGGKASAARTSQYRPGVKPPQRFSPSTIGFVAVAVVVVIIVGFVIFKITGKSPTGKAGGNQAPVLTPAPASLVSQVTGVPTSVATTVGLPSTNIVNPPTYKKGQPNLVLDGKPGVVFVGAEFCPYCAAERWAMIMALSKFGTFTGLSETTSSPWDVYPATPTFSFYGSSYSSPYITLDDVEAESNDTGPSGGRAPLQTPNAAESKAWSKYDTPSEGFPFLDIGNKFFVTTGASYLPSTLGGLDQADVASKLKNPKDPVTQAIVGTANYLTAGICTITGQKPTSVCSPAVYGKATKAMGLS